MKSNMVLMPAILESYRSLKDKTLKVIFETNEPTPEQLTEIALSNQTFGYLAFSKNDDEGKLQKIMESLPKTDLEFGKTKSQRLRGVLYRLWEQDKKNYKVFDDFYNFMMEQIIDFYKQKLD